MELQRVMSNVEGPVRGKVDTYRSTIKTQEEVRFLGVLRRHRSLTLPLSPSKMYCSAHDGKNRSVGPHVPLLPVTAYSTT